MCFSHSSSLRSGKSVRNCAPRLSLRSIAEITIASALSSMNCSSSAPSTSWLKTLPLSSIATSWPPPSAAGRPRAPCAGRPRRGTRRTYLSIVCAQLGLDLGRRAGRCRRGRRSRRSAAPRRRAARVGVAGSAGRARALRRRGRPSGGRRRACRAASSRRAGCRRGPRRRRTRRRRRGPGSSVWPSTSVLTPPIDVVVAGLDVDRLARDVDAGEVAADVHDLAQRLVDALARHDRDVERDRAVGEAAALVDLGLLGARDDVARGQLHLVGRVLLHEALALRVVEVRALAARALGDQQAQPRPAWSGGTGSSPCPSAGRRCGRPSRSRRRCR